MKTERVVSCIECELMKTMNETIKAQQKIIDELKLKHPDYKAKIKLVIITNN